MFVASEDATSMHQMKVIPETPNVKRTKPLRHSKGRTDFPIQQRSKPLPLLLGIAVAS